MIIPVKLGLGSPIGSGKQFMPWIHIDDLCNIYIEAIEKTEMNGAYNAVSACDSPVVFARFDRCILGKRAINRGKDN